jgi:hypothetical protein
MRITSLALILFLPISSYAQTVYIGFGPVVKKDPKQAQCENLVSSLNKKFDIYNSIPSLCGFPDTADRVLELENEFPFCIQSLINLRGFRSDLIPHCFNDALRAQLKSPELKTCLKQTSTMNLGFDQLEVCRDSHINQLANDPKFITCMDVYQQGFPSYSGLTRFQNCKDSKHLNAIADKTFSQCNQELRSKGVSIFKSIQYCIEPHHQSENNMSQVRVCSSSLSPVVGTRLSFGYCLDLERSMGLVLSPHTKDCLSEITNSVDSTYFEDEDHDGQRSFRNALFSCQNKKSYDSVSENQTLKFYGVEIVSVNKEFDDSKVGGLSGLIFDPKKNVFHMVSDDPGIRNDTRFYSLEPNFSKGAQFKFMSKTILDSLDQSKEHKYRYDIDAEGITLIKNGDVVVSSETLIRGSKSFIRIYDEWGNQKQELFLTDKFLQKSEQVEKVSKHDDDGFFHGPFGKGDGGGSSHYYVDEQVAGIRPNKAFESLTYLASKDTLFTANEAPLVQDSLKDHRLVRIIRMGRDLKKGFVTNAEFAYELEQLEDNGISEMLALDEDRLWVLERSFNMQTQRVTAQIFEVNISQGKNYMDVVSFAKEDKQNPIQILKKKLVLNLNDLLPSFPSAFAKIDNFEGLSFGPKLPNGHQSIVMVTDNNFSHSQMTQILVLEYTP